MSKVIISDLDGTLTKVDVLDFLASQLGNGQNGKSASRKNHEIGEMYLKKGLMRLRA